MSSVSQPSREESRKLQSLGTAVINTEAAAVGRLAERINENFARACSYMLACEGRIVVTGMGKSGHICSKIAATLASTGSPSFFVHPGEASHGDLGMITAKDVVLALSNSGETTEILTIIPILKRLGAPLISLTGNPGSTLAREADVHIDVSVEQEACPLNLAPTSSTTAALAMGDALLIVHKRFATPFRRRDERLISLCYEVEEIAGLQITELYQEALEFKFSPDSMIGVSFSSDDLQDLAKLWGDVFLYVERLRTGKRFALMDDYVRWGGLREPEQHSVSKLNSKEYFLFMKQLFVFTLRKLFR